MTTPGGVLALPPGADPALLVPRPDIEHWVYRLLKPIGQFQVWTYAVVDLDPSGWAAAASLQLDVFASEKGVAYRLADAARRLVCSLPLVTWPEGVVNRVDVVDGPFWFPADTGPRYVARYRVVFHPPRRRA
jgi:hypothetical protein